jgi:hypothetical protein
MTPFRTFARGDDRFLTTAIAGQEKPLRIKTDDPPRLFGFCTEPEGYVVTRARLDRVLERSDMKRRLPEYRGQRYAQRIDATLACLCFG